jgi:hypothetical protein
MSDSHQPTNKQSEDHEAEIIIKQGGSVLFIGILGSILAIVPSVLLMISCAHSLPTYWKLILPIFWACIVGAVITWFWSGAVHDRIKNIHLSDDDPKQSPERLKWMPSWIGIFERALIPDSRSMQSILLH